MIRRFTVAAALASCCAAGMGCQTAMNCGDGCGRGSSMAFQKYDCSCDGACGACCGGANADGGGSTCGAACGDACNNCDPPMRRLMGWAFGCSGCGECYWNEWHNDPPPVCEPCNRCGQYAGAGSAGNYQAPYRHHDALAAAAPSDLPPLEEVQRPADPAADVIID